MNRNEQHLLIGKDKISGFTKNRKCASMKFIVETRGRREYVQIFFYREVPGAERNKEDCAEDGS